LRDVCYLEKFGYVKLPQNWNFVANAIPAEKIKKVKYYLVDFWYTDCEPCILKIPEFNAFYDKFKNRDDVAFISINTDYLNGKLNENHVLKRSKELHIKFPVVYDNVNSKLNNQLSVHSYPSKFIINNLGEVIAKTDNSELSRTTFEILIKELNK
jgi:thiol-disulfide isomerase/thioredoxin